jgi:hypothetical protein
MMWHAIFTALVVLAPYAIYLYFDRTGVHR